MIGNVQFRVRTRSPKKVPLYSSEEDDIPMISTIKNEPVEQLIFSDSTSDDSESQSEQNGVTDWAPKEAKQKRAMRKENDEDAEKPAPRRRRRAESPKEAEENSDNNDDVPVPRRSRRGQSRRRREDDYDNDKEEDEENRRQRRPRRQQSRRNDDDDDGEDERRQRRSRRPPSRRRRTEEDYDDDEEEEEVENRRQRRSRRQPTRRRRNEDDYDDDNDEDDRRQRRPRRQQSRRRRNEDDYDSDDDEAESRKQRKSKSDDNIISKEENDFENKRVVEKASDESSDELKKNKGDNTSLYEIIRKKKVFGDDEFSILENDKIILHATYEKNGYGKCYRIYEKTKESEETIGYIRMHQVKRRFTYYKKDSDGKFGEFYGLQFIDAKGYDFIRQIRIVFKPDYSLNYNFNKMENLSRIALKADKEEDEASLKEKYKILYTDVPRITNGRLRLNFSGADVVPSIKNFIARDNDTNEIIIMFFKQSADMFKVRFAKPFDIASAFGYAIAAIISH